MRKTATLSEWLWIVKFAATAALFVPLVTPGFSLAELFFSGSILYEEDFCSYSEQPSFVFGAAKNCELLVSRIAVLAAASYGMAFAAMLSVIVFVAAVSAMLSRKRR